MFSFNNPFGACESCSGLGYLLEIDPDLCVPDQSLSIRQGAIVPGTGHRHRAAGIIRYSLLSAIISESLDKPFSSVAEKHRKILFYGSGDEKITMQWEAASREGKGQFKRTFEGVIPNLLRRYKETTSEDIRQWIESFMTQRQCPTCKGSRLRKESLSILVGGRNIAEISSVSIHDCASFFDSLKLKGKEEKLHSDP